jgi:hypothetical protein
MDHRVIYERPLWSRRSCGELCLLGNDVWQRLCYTAKLIKQPKIRDGQGMYHGGILAASRQCINCRVLVPGLELHRELKPEELADPRVLRNRRQTLVKQVLEAEMVGAYDEWAGPEIRSLVLHGLHQLDQLPFIGDELGVVGSDGVAIERQWSSPLVQDDAEARARGVAIHHEQPREIW